MRQYGLDQPHGQYTLFTMAEYSSGQNNHKPLLACLISQGSCEQRICRWTIAARFLIAIILVRRAFYLWWHAYVASSEIASQLAEALDMKRVDSGGNFSMLVPDDEDVLFGRQKMDGDFVVSDIQLYLDLASHPARGEENAEHLLEQKLQPKW